MEPAVQEMLNSPKLALHVRTFNRVLEEERQKREHFYNDVTEYDKAEFINGEIIVHSPVTQSGTPRRVSFCFVCWIYTFRLGIWAS